MKDYMRTVFLKLGDSLHFLCHFALRNVSILALDIEPCMHVKVLADRINRHACLLLDLLCMLRLSPNGMVFCSNCP